jgi:hypothetical protein
MVVPGLTAGGSSSHWRSMSGELGMVSPASVGRKATFVRFGPVAPVAPGMPPTV